MSRGTVSDTLFRLEAFNRIFVLRPKIDFSQRVQGFWSKMTKLESEYFSLVFVPRDFRVSLNSLGSHL